MKPADFKSLPLSPELLAVAEELGFKELTPIQAESIPHLLAGKDLVGQSKTGSGKTAAFTLPLLSKIKLNEKRLQAVVLCPTRELATQVVTEMRKWGRRYEGLQILPLVGGQPGRAQSEALERGVQIAVGTPGRVLDLIERQRIDLEFVTTLVLDEADKMLDLGFEAELRAILKALPTQRQTALFSATFPDSIRGLSQKYQKNPIQVTVSEESPGDLIEQWLYDAEGTEKAHTLMRVLQQHPSESTLIFCNMKSTVDELAGMIADQGVSCYGLHGDLEQRERERVLTMFRNGSCRILVATDVAARGLDIEHLELVINFDLPTQAETYVHRIGRTGRAGRTGVAVTLASPRDSLKILELENLAKSKFLKQALGFKNQHGLGKSFRETRMQTLSISGGRKDKLRPGDILGALTGESGGLNSADVGKIEIHDNFSYVAISSAQASTALERLRARGIKGKKFQIKFMK